MVITDGGVEPAPVEGVTVIAIRGAQGEAEVAVYRDGEHLSVVCDELSHADAVACARRLARYRPDL
ncbi:hypothetical protein C6A85_21530, partial [Mycobacterium sp. ITM-2017-0098]